MGSSGHGYESPMVKQELAKLGNGGDKRRGALASLRACVDKLDASTMPRFLSQLSDSRDHTDSRPYAISLYQDVARVHGKLVVPYIPRIMASVIRSLSSSGSSIHLHEACSKVVASIARYTILPTSATYEVDSIFHDLCNPLTEVLVGKLEPLATGAAVCLQALVESDKWRYAPEDVIAEVCSKSSLALRDRAGQTCAHMQLARALVRVNAVTSECGLAFLRSSKEILRTTSSWQHKAAALQLVRVLMLGLDRQSLALESESIAHIMEQIRLDRIPHVRNEAVKALQVLKAVVTDEDRDGGTARMLLSSAEKLDATKKSRSLWDREVSSASALTQESQVISLTPPPESPESSAHSTGRLRLSYLARRGSSSSSSSSSIDVCDGFTAPASAASSFKFDTHLEERAGDFRGRSLGKSRVMENLRYSSTVLDESDITADDNCYALDCLDTPIEQPAANGNKEYFTDECSDSTPVSSTFTDRLTPERSTAELLTAEDFIRFTTPRRLVRSLQTLTPEPAKNTVAERGVPETDDTPCSAVTRASMDMELVEALSETGWSVRDNPIAAAEEHNRYERLGTKKLEWNATEEPVETSCTTNARTQVLKVKHEVLNLRRSWRKVLGFVELSLAGFLCLVLLVPMAMAIVQIFHALSNEDGRALVPT